VALRDQLQDLGLPGGELRESRCLARADQRLDDLGVQGDASAGDPVQRVVELVQVEYPVLEQIAESGCAHQLGAVPELDVLGEEQDTDAGIFLVARHAGSRSVGLVVGRHPDVRDCEQWAGRGNGRQQSGSVPHCGGHLVSEVSQQSHRPSRKSTESCPDRRTGAVGAGDLRDRRATTGHGRVSPPAAAGARP
jgi:hypothetical protein